MTAPAAPMRCSGRDESPWEPRAASSQTGEQAASSGAMADVSPGMGRNRHRKAQQVGRALMAKGQLAMLWLFAPVVPQPVAEVGLRPGLSREPAAPLPAATVDASRWRCTGRAGSHT